MMIISRSSDFLPIFLALFLTTRIQCFAPSNNFQRSPSSFLIFANPQENEEPTDPLADPMIRSTEASSSTTSSSSLSYPINLPSPILLGSSMILAIIGTGKNNTLNHELRLFFLNEITDSFFDSTIECFYLN